MFWVFAILAYLVMGVATTAYASQADDYNPLEVLAILVALWPVVWVIAIFLALGQLAKKLGEKCVK